MCADCDNIKILKINEVHTLKKLISSFTAAFLCLFLLSGYAFCEEYKYFYALDISPSGLTIDFSGVQFVSGRYYAQGEDAQERAIFYSYDALSWKKIDGTEGTKMVSPKWFASDKIVFSKGNSVYYATQPSNIVLSAVFDADAAVNYVNGLYCALTGPVGGGKIFYYSLDGVNWYRLFYTILSANISVSEDGGEFFVSGLETAEEGFADFKISKTDMSAKITDEYDKNVVRIISSGGKIFAVSVLEEGESSVKYSVSTMKNNAEIILDKSWSFCMFGDYMSVTDGNKVFNLIADDSLYWYQVDPDSAMCILSAPSSFGQGFFPYSMGSKIYSYNGNGYTDNLAGKGIEVTLDGAYIAFDRAPVIQNERTLVPIRAISEALGAKVEYESGTRLIRISRLGSTIEMYPDRAAASVTYADGTKREYTLDCAPTVLDGRTLVTARFVSEILGFDVDWDPQNMTVVIKSRIPQAEVSGKGVQVQEEQNTGNEENSPENIEKNADPKEKTTNDENN